MFEELQNLKLMKITGIAIDHQPLVVPEHANTTNCYHAFMVYCINNFQIRIRNSETLKKWFKLSPNYPDFNRAIHYKRIHECNGLYYTDWRGTKQKESVMARIANELNIEVTFDIEG